MVCLHGFLQLTAAQVLSSGLLFAGCIFTFKMETKNIFYFKMGTAQIHHLQAAWLMMMVCKTCSAMRNLSWVTMKTHYQNLKTIVRMSIMKLRQMKVQAVIWKLTQSSQEHLKGKYIYTFPMLHICYIPCRVFFNYHFFQSIQQRYQFKNRAKVYSFSDPTVGSFQILPIM